MQLNVSKSWLEGEFCIRCNGGSGRVLVCSENGCPVGIHEACMNCEPQFDDMGKFYCPYCWYKGELARTKELRRKAMLAKNQLSNFICVRRDGENEEKQDDETVIMKGASVSTMAGKLNSGECENGLNDDGDKETIHHSQGGETVIMKGASVLNMAGNLNSGECENGLNDGGDKETIHHSQGVETVIMKGASVSIMARNLSSGECENGLNNDGDKETIHHSQGDETAITKGASVSTMAGKLNSGECANGLNDDGDKENIHHNQGGTQSVEPISKETSVEKSISRAHGFDNAGDGERIQEDSIENSGDSKDNEIDENRWQIQPYNSSHLGKLQGTLHVPTKETADAVRALEENQGKRGNEEAVFPKVSAIESFEFVAPDTETLLARPKRIKRTAQRTRFKRTALRARPMSYSPKNTKMNQEGKNIIGKKSVRCQESTKQLIIPTVDTEKRRRLHWTAEEENMLKEGVQRFSTKVNKNIPWRKILEYGHQVFHTTRTPVDLKDKWKNMMAKEALQK